MSFPSYLRRAGAAAAMVWQPLLGFCRIKAADLNAKPISQASLTVRAGDDK